MKAYVFPGQGAQFVGMGKDLYDNNPLAKELFEKANDILGFRITDLMFAGTDEDLRQTKVTQPAIFLHSVILAKTLGDQFKPDMTAGHSLGEFSALVAAGALSFEDGLVLVSKRAMAMQKLAKPLLLQWLPYWLCRMKQLKRSVQVFRTKWLFVQTTTVRVSWLSPVQSPESMLLAKNAGCRC